MSKFCLFIIVFCVPIFLLAQNYPITGRLGGLNEKYVYFTKNNTFLKPATGCENHLYDSLIFTVGKDKSKNWFVRKIFNEHLIIRGNERFKVIIDPIFDFRGNYDTHRNDFSFLNTRGVVVVAKLASRIYFNTAFYENQGKFMSHIDDFYNTFGTIPGYGRIKRNDKGVYDFSNSYGSVSFKAIDNWKGIDNLNFTIGYDRLFIGDGYRSMLLSDFSAPLPFFKTNLIIGKFEYNHIISKATNPNYNKIMGGDSYFDINSEYKFKTTLYNTFTYKPNNNWSFTLFDAILLPESLNFGQKLVYALTPYIHDFAEVLHKNTPNVLTGFNGSYQNEKLGIFYTQLLVDQIKFKNNRFAVAAQIGYKNFDLGTIKNLYFQIEYNMANLYTYTNPNNQLHYGNQNQSLAHPAGNCFDEFVLIGGYNLNDIKIKNAFGFVSNFEFILKFNYLRYRKDTGFNLQDIFNYDKIEAAASLERKSGNQIINLDFQIIYKLNKANKMQVFCQAICRHDKFDERTVKFLNFGLRTTLKCNYYDY
ncbi:hypothetical protein LJC11_01310 [Bacteroidales bacterium OttesenSCG-928-I21]|nr:hypothetical protein [Bacteroidales bacterium OttesenSCG-928-I21]